MCGALVGGGAALKLWPGLPQNLSNPSYPLLLFSNLLGPSSSSLNYLSLSLASSLPLSPFTLPQCPEERGGAFQKPGDHSPLSASGSQSDRGIRIRIAVHSPRCPSDEPEGAREGGRGGGRRAIKGGVPRAASPLARGIPSVFTSLPSVALSSLFYTFWRTYTPHMCMHA